MHGRIVCSLVLFALATVSPPAVVRAQTGDGRGVVQQVLSELTGTFSVPIGKTRMAGADIALLRQLQALGLVELQEIPQQYWDSFLNRTQGMGTPVQVSGTQKLISLEPAIVPVNGQDLRIFRVKIADVTVDEVTTDQEYTGRLSAPGEKYRILLGTFRKVPTKAALSLGAALVGQAEVRQKFRAIVKYDQFAKAWTFVAIDTGLLGTNEWLSSNVT